MCHPLSSEPLEVLVKRDTGLVIRFADELVAELSLMELRLMCPCATCRSLRDQGEEVWPRPGSPVPLRIDDARFHGAWGINITWNDGHATGIFPFESLRSWSERHGRLSPGE
jgi:ATP-binding protein involved in chromosome partitioning